MTNKMTDEQRAREIVAKLDDWIELNRRTQRFPGNGREGQYFLCDLIAAALAEVRREERERASQATLDLALALRSLKAKPRLVDLAKLSKRIRARGEK